jgi:hypothetical protein
MQPTALRAAADTARWAAGYRGGQMRLDVYGRFQLEVLRENDAWVVYRIGLGTRTRDTNVVIPTSLAAEELAVYIDDLFHELCGPGQAVRVIS